MLNIVPTALNKMVRQVVINHPNTYNGFVLKKVLSDTAPQTLGGIGILSNEDEDDFDFKLLGECYAMQMFEVGYAASSMNDNNSNADYALPEFRFVIEPEPEPDSVEFFTPVKGDVLFLILGVDPQNSPRIAYEIVDIETVGNIPPFSVRYVTNKRSDLDIGI